MFYEIAIGHEPLTAIAILVSIMANRFILFLIVKCNPLASSISGSCHPHYY